MLEPAQTALLLVIITLSILLLVLGFQTFFILKESKETLRKINKILDSASFLSNPLLKLLLGTALTFFVGQKKLKEEKQKPQQIKEGKVRRFFKRSS